MTTWSFEKLYDTEDLEVPVMLQSAGIIIFDSSEAEIKFLCLRVYALWDFPKGLVESGEAPIQTAIRETEEECGETARVRRR